MLRSVHAYVNAAGKTDSRAGAVDAHGGRAEVWMARACTQAKAENHTAGLAAVADLRMLLEQGAITKAGKVGHGECVDVGVGEEKQERNSLNLVTAFYPSPILHPPALAVH